MSGLKGRSPASPGRLRRVEGEAVDVGEHRGGNEAGSRGGVFGASISAAFAGDLVSACVVVAHPRRAPGRVVRDVGQALAQWPETVLGAWDSACRSRARTAASGHRRIPGEGVGRGRCVSLGRVERGVGAWEERVSGRSHPSSRALRGVNVPWTSAARMAPGCGFLRPWELGGPRALPPANCAPRGCGRCWPCHKRARLSSAPGGPRGYLGSPGCRGRPLPGGESRFGAEPRVKKRRPPPWTVVDTCRKGSPRG